LDDAHASPEGRGPKARVNPSLSATRGFELPLQNSHSVIDRALRHLRFAAAPNSLLWHGFDTINVVDFIHLLTRFAPVRVPSQGNGDCQSLW
jgi:hypothetical protein